MREPGLEEVIERAEIVPWAGISKIPWADPDFSRRMLEQHLDQEHPGASRTFETIDRHVDWIESALLEGRPNAKILDLCCGPGLYCIRLAAHGHRCHGIDFSPASIEHANRLATEQGRGGCSFDLGDVLEAPLGDGYDLVMITYGELNTFPPKDARRLVRRAARALVPGGIFAVEIHERDDVRRVGEAAPIWYSARSGLFGDAPYVCLRENRWFEDANAAVSRYFVIDGAGRVATYQNTLQAYADDAYEELMREAGVHTPRRADALSGNAEDAGGLFVLFGRRADVGA